MAAEREEAEKPSLAGQEEAELHRSRMAEVVDPGEQESRKEEVLVEAFPAFPAYQIQMVEEDREVRAAWPCRVVRRRGFCRRIVSAD